MALRSSLDEPEVDEAPVLVATDMTADEYFAGPETMQPHRGAALRLSISILETPTDRIVADDRR
jgi:hypothetical protein